jgi:hypothetical protein
MSCVRAAIFVESGVCAAFAPVGSRLRSQPPQLMSDATQMALHWVVLMVGTVAVMLAGSNRTNGGTLPAGYDLARAGGMSIVLPGWTPEGSRSKTRIGFVGFGAPART